MEENKTIIIVDLQKDFYDPRGSLYVSGAEVLPARIASFVKEYDNVFFTLDWHPLDHCSFKQYGGIWPTHCVEYSWGSSLPDEVLNALDSNRQIISYYHKGDRSYREEYAAYLNIEDNELKILRGSDRIDVCGLCGDYCVGLTAKRLVELGLKDKMVLLMDCIGSLDGGSELNGIIGENGLNCRNIMGK